MDILKDIGSLSLKDIKARFRTKPERLGVEVEGKKVRIVQTERLESGERRVVTFGETDVNPWDATPLENQRLVSTIRRFGGDIQKLAMNVEDPTLRIRRMNLPKMPDRDLFEAIRWNFREQIDVPIEKYTVGYTPIDAPAEGNKIAIVAYGVAQEAITKHSSLIRTLGFKLVSLEPAATAILAAFHVNGLLDDDKYRVCIVLGDFASYFLVMKGTMVFFSRPLAGMNQAGFVKHIMRNLNMEEKDAEEAVVSWMGRPESVDTLEATLEAGAAVGEGEIPEKRIEASIRIYFSKLVVEIQRSVDAFCIMYGAEGVGVIHLCGMGVFYPGFVTHLNKTLGIDTRVFNPFEKLMDKERLTEDVVKTAPLYAVAVGLAIP